MARPVRMLTWSVSFTPGRKMWRRESSFEFFCAKAGTQKRIENNIGSARFTSDLYSGNEDIIHLFQLSFPGKQFFPDIFRLLLHWQLVIAQEQLFQLCILEFFSFGTAKLVGHSVRERI